MRTLYIRQFCSSLPSEQSVRLSHHFDRLMHFSPSLHLNWPGRQSTSRVTSNTSTYINIITLCHGRRSRKGSTLHSPTARLNGTRQNSALCVSVSRMCFVTPLVLYYELICKRRCHETSLTIT